MSLRPQVLSLTPLQTPRIVDHLAGHMPQLGYQRLLALSGSSASDLYPQGRNIHPILSDTYKDYANVIRLNFLRVFWASLSMTVVVSSPVR